MALPALSSYIQNRRGTEILDRRGRPVMTTRGGLQPAAAESAAKLGGRAYEESIGTAAGRTIGGLAKGMGAVADYATGTPRAGAPTTPDPNEILKRGNASWPYEGAWKDALRELGHSPDMAGYSEWSNQTGAGAGESTAYRTMGESGVGPPRPAAALPDPTSGGLANWRNAPRRMGGEQTPGAIGAMRQSPAVIDPYTREPISAQPGQQPQQARQKPAGGAFGQRAAAATPALGATAGAAKAAGRMVRDAEQAPTRGRGAFSPASRELMTAEQAPQGALTPKEPLIGRDASMGLLAAGLGTMAAGGRRGTTAVGALGEGGLAGLGTYLNLKRDREVDADYELTTDADGNLARIDMNKGTVDPITGKDGKPFKATMNGKNAPPAIIRTANWLMKNTSIKDPEKAFNKAKASVYSPEKMQAEIWSDAYDEYNKALTDRFEDPDPQGARAYATEKIRAWSEEMGSGAGGRGQGPSQEDLEFTARKHGMTVEQVKQRLGVQ